MNEYGLAIAMAAVPVSGRQDAGDNTAKPTIGLIGITREILDHARSIDKTIECFERSNLNF